MNKNKHLVFDERYVIEHSLNKNMSFKAIGKQILKDCTTVSKEVKAHIVGLNKLHLVFSFHNRTI